MTKKIAKTSPSTLCNRPSRILTLAALALLGSTLCQAAQETYEGTWYVENKQDNNHYLLCPSIYGNYNDNDDTPYVTTSRNGQDNFSLWHIEGVADGDDTFYHIIHLMSGKYLTWHGIVDTNNPDRLRLHLQAFDTPTDATLFVIEKNPSSDQIAIRPKSYDGGTNQRFWLDVSGSNKDNYWNGDYQGCVGFWYGLTDINNAAKWILVEADCVAPLITYNDADDTFSITSPLAHDDGVTFHYTTDGTTPTQTSTTYSGAFKNSPDVSQVRAIAVKGTSVSSESKLYAPHTYLFKTSDAANVSYYLIPPLDKTSTTDLYVTTSNVPDARMAWQLMPAPNTDGMQCYYLKNDFTGDYLYANGNMNTGSAITMRQLGDAGTEAFRHRFLLYEYTAADYSYFNIVPRKFAYRPPTAINNCLRKQNATDNTNPIGLYQDNANGLSRWQAIALPEEPRTLFDTSFAVTDSKTPYWKLQSVNNTNYYVAYPSGSNIYAEASTTASNTAWYFEEASHDLWNTYYHIRNAITGDYLYYDATTNNNHKFFVTNSPYGTLAENSLFIISRTASANSHDSFHIIPKSVKDTPNQANIAMNRVSNTNLRLGNSRNNTNAQWNLVTVDFHCAAPVFSYATEGNDIVLTISSPTPGASIYYTTDGSEPDLTSASSSLMLYEGPFVIPASCTIVKMIAARSSDGSDQSEVTIYEKPALITSASQITSRTGNYILSDDFTFDLSEPISFGSEPFKGSVDGQFHAFSLNCPMFESVEDAELKNITISQAHISTSGDAGAIACKAQGDTRIYNCGVQDGTVSGTHYVGSLVGLLDGASRVINCYSFADVSGGSEVAGIVGYNSFATTQTIYKTMVMNCMFYGNLTSSATKRHPVYGGLVLANNAATGVNNYNYFRDEADLGGSLAKADYYCSWPAEESHLTRFEYFRSLLNSNRELCAWWITGDYHNTGIVAKWVLDTDIAKYPILKTWDRYPSTVNRDPAKQNRAGTLRVTVKSGVNGGSKSETLTLDITDMDEANHDYGYHKVQLPYYNTTFGTPASDDWNTRYAGNYTDKVVTGWKVTSVTGGTPGTFVADRDADNAYNFADRECTQKDLFDVSGRVFAQGGFYYVPEGVTEIEIEAYWGTAIYLQNRDHYLDRVNINSTACGSAFVPAGVRPNTFNGHTVYNKVVDAVNQTGTSGTVYDYGIVLIGNVQHYNGTSNDMQGNNNNRRYTLMSADFDFDDEPDYCLQLQVGDGSNDANIAAARFDFLTIVPLGEAVKLPDRERYGIAILRYRGFFEVTETSMFTSTEFNYEQYSNGYIKADGSPFILNGGQFPEEFISSKNACTADRTLYFIVGGNATFKTLTLGSHNTQNVKTRHCPISVMGGEFETVSLSGILQSRNAANAYQDNPRLYTNGGKLGIITGAGQEAVNGNVIFRIDHSIIDEFYGGGQHAQNVITGNIDIVINNSRVGKFCGGPMMGDMAPDKIVTVRAKGTTFGKYYGAGNGGTAYSLDGSWDNTGKNRDAVASDWEMGNNQYVPLAYINNKGYRAKYKFQIWNMPSGTVANHPSRRYIYNAQFAKTTTHDVINQLTDCTVNGDFYGAGNLGAVDGNVTSTLTNCTINGSAYGGGYSASMEPFAVYTLDDIISYPWRDAATGICHDAIISQTPTLYVWTDKTSVGGQTLSTSKPTVTVDGVNYLYSPIKLDNLGRVSGTCRLTIDGSTHVYGSVFGGGNESEVGTTEVTVTDDVQVDGSVFGGGNVANATGTSTVTISGGTISDDVYGGGNKADVGGATNVTLTGGTVKHDVYGGGRGTLDDTDDEGTVVTAGTAATVASAAVELNPGVADDSKGCIVLGNIFGCNNLNGTPTGSVTVHVYATQRDGAANISKKAERDKSLYDLTAVYGGGNLAAYVPTATDAAPYVIIDGCGLTSIQTVYGGGNAASVPASSVTVNGCYEIGAVFGGGNGKDHIVVNGVEKENPGANVGFLTYPDDADFATRNASPYIYGLGTTDVRIYGGTIHSVYGGSDTKGNVRTEAHVTLDEKRISTGDNVRPACPFSCDEAYGGGRNAEMDGDIVLQIECIPGLGRVYGGATNADVGGDIALNITNGTYGQVFGGNNLGGSISGTINVNIEETGCRPVIIGELYGGGNQAPYAAPLGEPGPTLNVRSFTSIGDIYGGGYGASAVVTGDTYVNIDEVVHPESEAQTHTEAEYAGAKMTIDGHSVALPSHRRGMMGAIGTVFGGGNAADVVGDTHVAIGTRRTVDYITTFRGETEPRRSLTVAGADIRGNVYGGGNQADVTGKAHVVVGPEEEAGGEETP